MKKKSVNLVFLFLLLAVGCSQETVMNGSISGKTNASDTKMSINIVTETSRTVRPAVTKWKITVTNEEEENNLEYSKTVDSKTTSVTFINIVATATYTVEVHGLDEDGNKILSGAKEKVQVEANKVNICNVTLSDDFNTDKSDKNGTLSVNINGLGGLGIQENSNFTLKMSGLTNPDNPQIVTLSYKDGVLSGLESDILPGSYKISIADFPVNVIQDPIVNIYPGAVTTIDWTWNGNKNDVEQNNTLKKTLIPVWNKNADGGDSVGLIGANGLFVTPTWENGTFVACDVDTAGDMWTLTITEKKLSGTDEYDNEVYNYTYKLTNEHAKESYYFQASEMQKVIDFCVAEIDVRKFLENKISEAGDEIENVNEKIETTIEVLGEKAQYLILLTNAGECYTYLMNKNSNLLEFEKFYLLRDGFGGHYPAYDTQLSAIETCGTNLYMAGTNAVDNDNPQKKLGYIFLANITNICGIELYTENILNNLNQLNVEYLYIETYKDYSPCPILTLNIGEYIKYEDFSKGFYSNAFKITDMHVKGDNLYITAGCVAYSPKYEEFMSGDSDDLFCYSFGGLFRFKEISKFNSDNFDFSNPDDYVFGETSYEVTKPKIEYCGGLDICPLNNYFLKREDGTQVLNGFMQAKEEDSPYFAGPRYIIPSDDKLFIIDSGFYGEYGEEITDGNTGEKITIFSLKDKRNHIFTFDGSTLSAPIKLSDSISFDYDYITGTETFEFDRLFRYIPVSW